MVGECNFFGYSEGNAHQPLRPVLAVAITTDDHGTFLGSVGTTMANMHQPIQFPTAHDLISSFVRFSYRGHELLLFQADHDMRYLIPELEKLVSDGFEINFTTNQQMRIIYCKIKRDKHAWYIRDCSALLPLDVDELYMLAGMDKRAPLEQAILGAYNVYRDTMRDSFNTNPAITASTTALNGWATTLEPHQIFYRQRAQLESAAREGYYGGFVYIKDFAERNDCTYIDVNAMYAYAMRQGVPVMSGTATTKYYGTKRPGIYYCDVWCPPALPVPFVPCRNEHGFGVRYPRGIIFQTVLTSNTIELALQHGYKITVKAGYVFEHIAFPFNKFVDKCQELENKFRDRGARYCIKTLRNSLAGKFGQHPLAKEYLLSDRGDQVGGYDSLIDEGWTELTTIDGEWVEHLYYREVEVERSYMQPLWAMWITAEARNFLARCIYALGTEHVYYSDTDSLVLHNSALDCLPEIVQIGTQYGQWKIVDALESFRAMGTKFYTATTAHGEQIIKAAGLPRGVLTTAEVERILPHAPPITTRPYDQERRALHTVGGRPHNETVVKQIMVPELQPTWAQ